MLNVLHVRSTNPYKKLKKHLLIAWTIYSINQIHCIIDEGNLTC